MLQGPRPVVRRRHRLERSDYSVRGSICSVTTAVRERRPIFADQVVASAAVEVIATLAARTGVLVHVYCVMPDHVHFVITPSATTDIVTFVAHFKNLAQRAAWKAGVQGSFWQKSFWDRFLRSEESLESLIAYVLHNPVRAGIVEDPRDYPYSGSRNPM